MIWLIIIRKKHSTFEYQKKNIMKLLSKEMLINAGVTLAVVMVALYVHDKFVAPKMASGGSVEIEDY